MLALINLFGRGPPTIEGVAEGVDYEIEEVKVDTGGAFTRFMSPNFKEQRTVTQEEPRLSFRVKQFDEEGNPSDYTMVLASASSKNELPKSFIVEGDEVRVSGPIDGGLMQADELRNLRTGMTVNL